MASPKTVGQFYVETTRQTAKSAASAQDAAVRYLDEITEIGRAYFDAWAAAQNASLQTAFQLQNSLIEAARPVADATARANLLLLDEWMKSVAIGQEAVSKLTDVSISVVESAVPTRAR